MASETLGDALEREHREIDTGIEAYIAGVGTDATGSFEPLTDAMRGLRHHIYLEEEFLFPSLRDAGLTMPILVMLREHGELWRTMDAVDALLAKEAETETESVVAACHELLSQLDKHNSKEEPVIYPLVDAALAEPARTQLDTYIATGQTPAGWVCARAQS